MSQVAISGNASGTGTLTIAAPNTNSNFTLTLPQTTATLGIDGPAFSVYSNADQTTTSSVWTKITFQVEEYDTNNNFGSSRFTPTVAGYYQINGSYYSNGGPSRCAIGIYKNGSSYKVADTVATTYAMFISSLVYLNGSTDYVEIYMNNITGGTGVLADSTRTYFSGAMIRAA
jgi:hypothetical protein